MMEFFDYFDNGKINGKSMCCLGGAWILEFSYLFVYKIFFGSAVAAGNLDFFGTIFEWIFAIALIAALLIGGITDIINAQFTNIRIVISISIICRLLMFVLINIGIMALIGGLAIVAFLIILDMNIGGGMTLFLAVIAELLGVLSPIVLVIFLIGAIFGGALL